MAISVTDLNASSAESTLNEWIKQAARRLRTQPAARFETEQLLCHVLQCERAWLFAHASERLHPQQMQELERLLTAREQGEPIAYLLGRRGFWTLDLTVTSATLIPRPETESLVELALAHIPADYRVRIADLGTGSGAIALAIAAERPLAHLVATDLSTAALDVAHVNAKKLGLANIEFRLGDWYAALLPVERFDLIVSNPPYIAESDPHLSQGDLRFEPRLALIGGMDGLEALRRLVSGAPAYLKPGGWLLLEHGYDQGTAVRHLLGEEDNWQNLTTERDLEERERVTLAQWVYD